MANRFMYQDDYVSDPRMVSIYFQFQPNGTGAVNNALNVGAGNWAVSTTGGLVQTVTRTGVGAFNIVLNDPYTDLLDFGVSQMLSAIAAPLTAEITAYQVNNAQGGPPYQISFTMVNSAGTATDIAANASNRLFVNIILKNSSLAL